MECRQGSEGDDAGIRSDSYSGIGGEIRGRVGTRAEFDTGRCKKTVVCERTCLLDSIQLWSRGIEKGAEKRSRLDAARYCRQKNNILDWKVEPIGLFL